MLKISKQQLYQRWDILPDNLREALFSEINADILWQICEAQHLSKDKISVIATIAGDAILGFIHSEDLAQEIRLNLDLNLEIANLIAYEIDRKIFAPIRGDLRKNYASAVASPSRKATDEQSEVMADKPAVAEETSKDKLQAPVADIRQPAAEEFKPSEIPVSISVSAEEVAGGKPFVAEAMAGKETEIPELKKEELSVYGAVMEGPAIIHKEEEIKPTSQAPRSLGGLFGFLKKKSETKPEPQSVTAQVILTEQAGKPEEKSEIAQTEKPKMRVVHYSEFSTPVDVFGKQPTTDNLPRIAEQSSLRGRQPITKDQQPMTENFQQEESRILSEKERATTEIAPKQANFIDEREQIMPQAESIREVELKDIPVEEDVVDLRNL